LRNGDGLCRAIGGRAGLRAGKRAEEKKYGKNASHRF
jgi:hypothetical protein